MELCKYRINDVKEEGYGLFWKEVNTFETQFFFHDLSYFILYSEWRKTVSVAIWRNFTTRKFQKSI